MDAEQIARNCSVRPEHREVSESRRPNAAIVVNRLADKFSPKIVLSVT